MTRAVWFALSLLCVATPLSAQPVVLVEQGSALKYLDNTSDPDVGLTWTNLSFDDTFWPAGFYGIGYEAGSGAQNLITTSVTPNSASVYTRAEFTIPDISQVQTLFLGVDWDDGYVAWVNGVEVARSNQMPTSGGPDWNTTAGLHESSNGASPDYGTLINISPVIPFMQTGTNVLAIGAWNGALPSSDLVLVPQLTMNLPAPPERGPYLQRGNDTSLVVRWRSSVLTDSVVHYGASPTHLTSIETDPTLVMDHEVILTGLAPDTIYHYTVGGSGGLFAASDPNHHFRTAPITGTRRPLRAWVLGDSGTANANAEAVRDAYLGIGDGVPTNLWLMLGDNAYPLGTDDNYQAAVFETYPQVLPYAVLWPTIGNHDVASNSTFVDGPYYDLHTLPDSAQAGGVASGTEAYYSFDYGNAHFISLNSQDVDRSPTGAMLTWVEQDLMDTMQDWVIAFWHHPPYSKGSHDSDSNTDSGGRLVQMRQWALPVLESHGVDLVLTGHSHSYERSYMLDQYYGYSGSLIALNLPQGTDDGRIDGDGPYQKATQGPAPNEGAVHIVAGNSGQLSGGALNHEAMYISWNLLGSVVLDIEGDRLTARFLDSNGIWRDSFTMVKDTGSPPIAGFSASPAIGPMPLTVDFTDLSTTNTASWSWDFDGNMTTDSSEPSPSHTYTASGFYTVGLTVSNKTGSDDEIKTNRICVSVAIPGEILDLVFDLSGTNLTWGPIAGASGFDVLKGDLDQLQATGGDFGSTVISCLQDGPAAQGATDTDRPGPGNAFYYLVRGVSLCNEEGTYDSGAADQSTSRDASIDTSLLTCP